MQMRAGPRREREHEFFSRHVEAAGRPRDAVEHDALCRRVDTLARERRAPRAWTLDAHRRIERGGRNLDCDQHSRRGGERANHDTNLRPMSAAAAANAAQTANEVRNARAIVRSTAPDRSSRTRARWASCRAP